MQKSLLSLLFLLLPLYLWAQGTATVYQGSDIDNVVNSRRTKPKAEAPKPAETKTPATPAEAPTTSENTEHETTARQTKLVQKRVLVKISDSEAQLAKGAGFRIQVFSGGNTRDARQEAERAGHKVKAAMPELPVYVHFYTPRWGCRVGNFRTYKDAQKVLKKIWKLGYKQAIILRKPGQLDEKKK